MMPSERERMMDYARRGGRRDMAMDGRNPYGSRGGYVMSRRRRDRAMMMDGTHDMGDYRGYGDRERYARQGDSAYAERDSARGRRDYERGGQYDSAYRPIEVMGRFDGYYGMDDMDYARGRDYDYDMARSRRTGRYMRNRAYDGCYDYGYDYADGDNLSPVELKYWMEDLMGELEEKDKPMFKMENIIKRAKEMGIQFDKFSEEEFHTAVLMAATDYGKTVGMSNIDTIIMIAKDFLCDPDSNLKYAEKLAAYYDYVVKG